MTDDVDTLAELAHNANKETVLRALIHPGGGDGLIRLRALARGRSCRHFSQHLFFSFHRKVSRLRGDGGAASCFANGAAWRAIRPTGAVGADGPSRPRPPLSVRKLPRRLRQPPYRRRHRRPRKLLPFPYSGQCLSLRKMFRRQKPRPHRPHPLYPGCSQPRRHLSNRALLLPTYLALPPVRLEGPDIRSSEYGVPARLGPRDMFLRPPCRALPPHKLPPLHILRRTRGEHRRHCHLRSGFGPTRPDKRASRTFLRRLCRCLRRVRSMRAGEQPRPLDQSSH